MTSDMEIRLERADRVTAHWAHHVVSTDQDDTAPSPFDLFLASIGTCTGFYVSRFCRKRQLDPTGIRIVERVVSDPETHRVERIEIELGLPPEFPDRYREAVLRAAGQCAVKQQLDRPPAVRVGLAPPEEVVAACAAAAGPHPRGRRP
jgi:ribosomal protein S12 methylthiotransferase accessory factor